MCWLRVKRTLYKFFHKRAGIESTIGHLKIYYRLGQNFYKRIEEKIINAFQNSY